MPKVRKVRFDINNFQDDFLDQSMRIYLCNFFLQKKFENTTENYFPGFNLTHVICYKLHMLQNGKLPKVFKIYQKLPKVAYSPASLALEHSSWLLWSVWPLLFFFAYWTKPIDQFFATQSLSNMHNCFGGTLARIAFSFTLRSVKKSNCLDNKEKFKGNKKPLVQLELRGG